MAHRKRKKKKLNQRQKEERETKYLRRRLAWCNQTGEKFDESLEQYTLLPRAIADIDGNPNKGQKSKWMDKLHSRYSVPNLMPFTPVPPMWIPGIAIIDAMFCINVNLLFKQFALVHYRRGTQEVHFVFDHPGRLTFNPKDCEHSRRYGDKSAEHTHTHIKLTPQSAIPRPWREFLECRECKRSIVETLGMVYLLTATFFLRDHQVLVLAGCFSGEAQDYALVLRGNSIPQLTSTFKSNAQEADMRMWRHYTQTQHQRVIIYSPDTDVATIDILLVQPNKECVVQYNLPQNTPKYVDIKKLLNAFQCDPDLASIPEQELGSTMLQLYAATGCDYVSFFSEIGKAQFMNIFFQHSDFITGKTSNGNLWELYEQGFPAFVRLIGTAYFKKNLATTVSKLGFETPDQLMNSIGTNQCARE